MKRKFFLGLASAICACVLSVHPANLALACPAGQGNIGGVPVGGSPIYGVPGLGTPVRTVSVTVTNPAYAPPRIITVVRTGPVRRTVGAVASVALALMRR